MHTEALVIFLVQNFEFQYFLGFQKNKYFLRYENFVDIFWGHHKIVLYLGVISMYLGSFLKVNVQNRGYCLGLLKFQIFLGCLKFLIFLRGER